MDIDELRRNNLRAESERLGGDKRLADALGVDKNQVYQWLRAEGVQRRNMRKTTARQIERKLGRAQGWLDIDHRQPILAEQPNRVGMMESRAKNNVTALRFAIQSMFYVLSEKMPDIAEAVAADIVETAGTSFAGQGFLSILVGTLRGAAQTTEDARQTLQQVQVSSTSRRASSAAKRP